jgi:RNA polymerase sigma-70 factor (ECF subfamily)
MVDNSPESPTRPSLLLRVRDPHDGQAWETFVAVYSPLIYGHCRKKGLHHEDAEDVTQKVFARVLRFIGGFEYRPETGRFRDWLGTLVRNEINRFLKQQTRAVRGQGGSDAEEMMERVEARGEETAWTAEFNAHILQTALGRSRPHFADDTWRAFEGLWRDNRPAPQVAQELGRPIDWVYVAKSRVLKRLWQEVLELADDSTLLGS